MRQSSHGLRALRCRWQAAIETTTHPKLKQHFAGHVIYLSTLADRMDRSKASTGEARIKPVEQRDDRRTVVLVLEDDDACRDMTRGILRAAGFDVICARNFEEAVRCVEEGAIIDIALIDVTMPAGSPHGISFARVAQTRRPSLKVIFMSAHSRSADLGLIDDDEAFLCKPFAPHQLLEVVTRAAA